MSKIEHKWSGRTDGSGWMQRMLIRLFRVFDVRVIYAVMAVVIVFYMLFRRTTFLAQYRYFRSCYSYRPIRAFVAVYQNHYMFGQAILDRFASYAGQQYKFIFEGEELFRSLVSGKKAFVVVSSHIGNYELAGYSLSAGHKPMNVLAYSTETPTVTMNRERLFARQGLRVITVRPDSMDHIYEIYNAVSRGEIVSMPGDRIYGETRTVDCKFFGRNARFLLGVHRLAAKNDLREIAMFVMKEHWDTYRIIVREINADKSLDVSSQAQQMARQYANLLENTVRQYKTQFYHYDNFWE